MLSFYLLPKVITLAASPVIRKNKILSSATLRQCVTWMCRVEVDFEPSDAMVERAVHRVVHRVAERDRHQHRDQDGEEDAEAHNSVMKFATNN